MHACCSDSCVLWQGIGIAKAIVSLTLFHEGRMWLTTKLKERNVANGWVPAKK